MRGEDRKNQILKIAIRLFSRNGYYQTHVEHILQEAKMGRGTFYIYFKNKDDLFVSILEKFLTDWEQTVLVATASMEQDDLAGYFQELITRSFNFFKQNKDLCNIYLRIGPGINDVFEPYINRFETRMLQYVINELQRGIDRGFFPQTLDVELIANILLGAHLRIAYYYFVLKKKKRGMTGVEHISEEFFNLIIRGLRY
jgi:TetR/AcrR family fatty acid metabolism transcriptional regulator